MDRFCEQGGKAERPTRVRLIVAKTLLYMVVCAPSPVAVHICGFHVCAMHCPVEPFSALFAVVLTYASCNHVAKVLFLGL